MNITHIAIWTENLERLVHFYQHYFKAEAGTTYKNPSTGFVSRFLGFPEGARLELMTSSSLQTGLSEKGAMHTGYAHIAIATGSTQAVDNLTHQLELDGFQVIDGPRTTGDGYYESVVLDPDGNLVEITV